MQQDNLKHKTKVGMYWTFLSQISTQLVQFVVGIVMARLLTPSDFGITALPAVFMAVSAILMDGGFAQALIRKPEITDKDLSTSFYYNIGMGCVLYAVLFVCSPFIADFYNTPILTDLIRVTALTFLWGPLGTPQKVILNRRLDFRTQAWVSIINNVISGGIGIYLAYWGLGLWSLVITGLAASLLGLIQTWIIVRWMPKFVFSKESFDYLWNYGNKMIASNLIDTLYNNVAPIIIGKFYTTKDLGIYNRADGYAKLPANQLYGVLNSVVFPVLSKIQDDNERLRSTYRRMIKFSCYISFPIFIAIAALAKPLVIVLVTDKWIECVPLLQILCFERLSRPISSLNKNLLLVKGRSDLFLKLEMIKKPIFLVITLVSLPFGLTVFCYSQIFVGLVAILLNTHYTGKILRLGFLKQMNDITPALILSLITGAGIFGTTILFDNYIIQLLIGVIVGLSLYLALSIIFKFSELQDVIYFFYRKK